MSRITKLLVMFLTLLVVTGAWMSAQRSGDRPPGVPTERWIPLAENSGIVLRDTTRTFNNKGWRGILFVKVATRGKKFIWIRGLLGPCRSRNK